MATCSCETRPASTIYVKPKDKAVIRVSSRAVSRFCPHVPKMKEKDCARTGAGSAVFCAVPRSMYTCGTAVFCSSPLMFATGKPAERMPGELSGGQAQP